MPLALYREVAESMRQRICNQELNLNGIFPVMALVEGRCAYDAVCKAKPQDLKRLDGIHAKLEESAAAGDIDRYQEHRMVMAAFHNKNPAGPIKYRTII